MKDHCSTEELSAYVDGKSKQPGRIADHLTRCPECTWRCREFAALSARLHSLPDPELNPAFVTRVLAHASETRQEPSATRAWTWPRIVMAGGMAAVVTLGVFLGVRERGYLSDTAFHGKAVGPYPGLRFASDSLDAAGTLADEVSAEDLIAGLADTEWFATLAAAWEDEDELDAVIQSLNSDETVTFEKLLHEYAEENRTI